MITGAITSFATGTYTRIRMAAGSYVKGYWQAGASTESSFVACVQPVAGRDLRTLPEGRRPEETRVVYTTTELRVSPADRVTIGGEAFEVFQVSTWEAFGTTHYKALAARVAPTASSGGGEIDLAAAALSGTGTVV